MSYTFDIKSSQEVFVGLNVYPKRMYPMSGCNTRNNGYTVSLLKDGKKISSEVFNAVKGFGWLREMDLAPGKYEILAK